MRMGWLKARSLLSISLVGNREDYYFHMFSGLYSYGLEYKLGTELQAHL